MFPVEGDILDTEEENSDGEMVKPKDDDDGTSLPAKCSRSSKCSIPPKDVEVGTSFPTKHYGSLRPLVIDNHSDVEGHAKDDNETASEGHKGDCSDD